MNTPDNNPSDGGAPIKERSNPVLSNIGKYGVIAVPLSNPPDADKAALIHADDYESGLQQLMINILLEILTMDGQITEVDYPIRKSADLEEKGIVAQVPVLQELQQRQQDLHKLHEQLAINYRTQKSVEKLMHSAPEKEAFVQVLLLASEFFSSQN